MSDKPASLNNHERLRRELWNAVFLAEFGDRVPPWSSLNRWQLAAQASDKALELFDNRFPAP